MCNIRSFILAVLLILGARAGYSSQLQTLMPADAKQESVRAETFIATKAVKRAQESAFALLPNFNIYGHTSTTFLDYKRVVDKLTRDATNFKNEFYIVDIGAGTGALGTSIYEYIHSREFKEKHHDKVVKFHIVSLVGEHHQSTITIGDMANHYYVTRFMVEDIANAFREITAEQFRVTIDISRAGNLGIKTHEEFEEKKNQIRHDVVEKLHTLHNKVDWFVSSWCFMHLVDPMGTFKQAFDMLRPGTGLIEVDGFPFLTIDDQEDIVRHVNDLISVLDHSGQPFLLKRGNKDWIQEGPFSILMQRKNDRTLELDLAYKKDYYKEDDEEEGYNEGLGSFRSRNRSSSHSKMAAYRLTNTALIGKEWNIAFTGSGDLFKGLLSRHSGTTVYGTKQDLFHYCTDMFVLDLVAWGDLSLEKQDPREYWSYKLSTGVLDLPGVMRGKWSLDSILCLSEKYLNDEKEIVSIRYTDYEFGFEKNIKLPVDEFDAQTKWVRTSQHSKLVALFKDRGLMSEAYRYCGYVAPAVKYGILTDIGMSVGIDDDQLLREELEIFNEIKLEMDHEDNNAKLDFEREFTRIEGEIVSARSIDRQSELWLGYRAKKEILLSRIEEGLKKGTNTYTIHSNFTSWSYDGIDLLSVLRHISPGIAYDHKLHELKENLINRYLKQERENIEKREAKQAARAALKQLTLNSQERLRVLQRDARRKQEELSAEVDLR